MLCGGLLKSVYVFDVFGWFLFVRFVGIFFGFWEFGCFWFIGFLVVFGLI